MDSDNDSYHSENEFNYPDEISYFLNVKRTRTPGLKMAAVKIQHKNCLQSTLRKKIINTLFAGLGRSVMGKPVPEGRPQDLWHSFSQYGPPGRQITAIHLHSHLTNGREKRIVRIVTAINSTKRVL